MRLRSLVPLLAAALAGATPALAHAKGPDHGGAAAGGAVGGLLCGGGTIAYAAARAGGREAKSDDPMLWHQAAGPGVLVAFFGEHALVGGATGAFGDGPRAGFLIGGAVTCTLDVVWIIASEVIAYQQEPAVALVQHDDGGWRLAPPPVAIRRDGAYVSLFAVQF